MFRFEKKLTFVVLDKSALFFESGIGSSQSCSSSTPAASRSPTSSFSYPKSSSPAMPVTADVGSPGTDGSSSSEGSASSAAKLIKDDAASPLLSPLPLRIRPPSPVRLRFLLTGRAAIEGDL